MTHVNQTQQLLNDLAALVKPFGVVSLATDYLVTKSRAYRRCVVLHRHGKKKAYAVVSRRPEQRENGLKALRAVLGMNADIGDKVLDAAEALSELNDLGAWPVEADERAPLVATETGIGGTPYDQLPAMEQAFASIQSALPRVARIDVQVSTLTENNRNSRKGWLHFYDAHGNQTAAIATNMLASHLRGWYDLQDENRQTADRHLKRWATQLDAEQGPFTHAMISLMTLDTFVGITGVDLANT